MVKVRVAPRPASPSPRRLDATLETLLSGFHTPSASSLDPTPTSSSSLRPRPADSLHAPRPHSHAFLPHHRYRLPQASRRCPPGGTCRARPRLKSPPSRPFAWHTAGTDQNVERRGARAQSPGNASLTSLSFSSFHQQELGWYDPIKKQSNLNAPAIKAWLAKGAQPSDTVGALLRKSLIIEK